MASIVRNSFLVIAPVLLRSASTRSLSTSRCSFAKKAQWISATYRKFKEIDEKLKRDGNEHKIKRSQYSNWNFEMELKTFSNRFKENFDLQLLNQALVDESFVHGEKLRRQNLGLDESSLTLESNKNLADIGYVVIQNYCKKYFQNVLPLLPTEGVEALTEYLSSDEITCEVGKSIGLRDLILTESYLPSDRSYSMAFKAVIGALKESSGNERAELFVRDFLIAILTEKDIIDIWHIEEPLVTLQSILKQNGLEPPEPRIMYQAAIGTIEANYQIGIYSDKQIIGKGQGETISTAIEIAALNCLQRIFKINPEMQPLPMKNTNSLEFKESKSIKNFVISDTTNIYICNS